MVANTYLEGSYTDLYPRVTQDADGLAELVRQFSFPGGIPSHAAPETPGLINEGGELGYALAHAYGAALDNPDLLVACVVGDGEAETGALAASWHSNKFLNPATDGAVLPILHLNGYKIANPTVLARIPEEELCQLLEGYGHRPIVVAGHEPEEMHHLMAAALDDALDDIDRIRSGWRTGSDRSRPRWPLIVLRTPKGWTGPREVDGVAVEGTFRSQQVPLAALADRPEHLAALETWLRSYRLDELFSTRRDGRAPRSRRWHPPATGAWARTHTPTGSAASRSRATGLPRPRRGRPRSGRDHRRSRPGARHVAPGRDGGQRRPPQLPGIRSR